MSKSELLEKCKELGITRCSSKNKSELLLLIDSKIKSQNNTIDKCVEELKEITTTDPIPPPQSSDEVKNILLSENQSSDNIRLNVIDLFCGCGGMSKGLTDAGLNVIAGIDIWDKAVESYNKNFEHKAYCEDLTNLPPEKFNELYNKENHRIDILVGGPPCFIAGTPVLTYVGYKNIENVLLEDELLTHTGKFQKIVNLQRKRYSGDLYELNIKHHSDAINCTQEHPFLVREKKRIWDNSIKKHKIYFDKPVWKIAKELTLNDYYGMVINNNEIIPEFKDIKLDKKEYWYIMGYLVGNGYIVESKTHPDKPHIYFTILNKFSKEIVFTIRKVVAVHPIQPTTVKNQRQCKTYGCKNKVWVEIFKMFGKYACDKTIPEWVHDAPKEFIREFINGYMKANGNINDKGLLQMQTISYNLAHGLQRLYLKLGHVVGINKCINDDSSVNKRYCIQGYLTKKRNVSSFIENNYVWYAPIKIYKKNTSEIKVYNFEVANDNSYIVMNTVVHNCTTFSMAGRRDKNDPRNALFMEYVKYLDYFNPKAFIMENVIGILSKKTANGENVIDIVMEHLSKNYNCIINKLYASDFEVPQNRRRTIIIGIRKDLNILPTEPEPIIKSIHDRIPVKTILIPRENVDKKYYLSEKALTGIKNKKELNKEKGLGFGAQMLDFEKPSYTIPARYWKDGYDALVKYNETEIRRLTIIELKRIQSFPDNYIINGSNKDVIMQIGNAVACKFAYYLGKYIINTLQ